MHKNDSLFPLGDRFFWQFWLLRLVSFIGLVVSFFFLSKPDVFGWIEVTIAILLTFVLISVIPLPSKEGWVSEEYYKEYMQGMNLFFMVYFLSISAAVLGAWSSFVNGETSIWLPVSHVALVAVRIWSLLKYPDRPIPPPEEYDGYEGGYGCW